MCREECYVRDEASRTDENEKKKKEMRANVDDAWKQTRREGKECTNASKERVYADRTGTCFSIHRCRAECVRSYGTQIQLSTARMKANAVT